MNWYYVDQGQQAGPVSDTQFQELVRSGKIRPDTLVWREGLAAWVAYRDADGTSTPPAPAPAAPAGYTVGENPQAVCAECGKMFAVQDMIRHGTVHICANCKPIFMQKLAEGAQINTGELHYAGFWIRFGAKIMDGLILGVPFAIVFVVVIMARVRAGGFNQHAVGSNQFSFLPLMVQFGFIFIRMAYEIFFLGKYGATPGKMVCKLKVVTADGGPIGYGRATGRFFAEIVSGLICYIGYIMVAFDDQKRALHDYICNTRVILK